MNPGITNQDTILIGTDEHRVVSETIPRLRDAGIYRRGTMLVRIIRSDYPDDRITRATGTPIIQPLPIASLRERITQHATFGRPDRKGNMKPCHPPGWLVSAIDARGEWNEIRPLQGISDSPILRPDGSVWQSPGYDEATGVLFEPSNLIFPNIDAGATIEDAKSALDRLLEVVCDFAFETPAHQSAWLAGLLTPLARFAFEGPAPLFLLDANVRAAGKTLLAQTIGHIAFGRDIPVSSYVHASDEMRKRVTSLAIAGDRLVLLDNLDGVFGNDVIDRALTGSRWKDRILGRSEDVDLPLHAVWYATGNNVQVAADTCRRIIHIRLEVMEENPENRSGFRHPNLLAWIAERRGSLLTDALTILSAYCRASRPNQNLPAFGSFEGWSDLVRQAVVWLGLPDPNLTRSELSESADTVSDNLSMLFEAWKVRYEVNRAVNIPDILAWLYPPDRQFAPQDETASAIRTAIEQLTDCQPGKVPTSKQVAARFKSFRKRVINGHYLSVDDGRSKKGKKWRLRCVTTYDRGVSGVSDVSVLSHAGEENHILN